MNTETVENTLQFPLAINMQQVDAGKIVVEADLLPETLSLIASAKNMILEGRHVEIHSHTDYETAAGQLAKIKAAAKSIEDQRKSLTKPLDDRKKEVMDFVRPFTDALSSAETIFKNGLIAFDNEQERLRKLAEAEAEEKRRKEEAKLLAQAEKAEASGKGEKAEALREIAASTVVATPAVSAPQKVSGVSSRKTYSCKVTNMMELVKAVAAGTVPLQALQVDQSFLNKMAAAFKDEFSYPGCSLEVGTSMAVRAAK